MHHKEDDKGYGLFHTFIILLLFTNLGILLWQISKPTLDPSKALSELRDQITGVQDAIKMQTEKPKDIEKKDVSGLISLYTSVMDLYKNGEAFYEPLRTFIDLMQTFDVRINVAPELFELCRDKTKTYWFLKNELGSIEEQFLENLSKNYETSPEGLQDVVVIKDKKRLMQSQDYIEFQKAKDNFSEADLQIANFDDLSKRFPGVLDTWVEDLKKRSNLDAHMLNLKAALLVRN